MSSIEVVVAEPAQLGECPLWSAQEQLLYWIDIDGRAVHRYNPANGVDELRATPGRPGSLALTSEPGVLLMATEHEVVWFDWPTGTVTPWIELHAAGNGVRLNDGRTDSAGRFWVGSMFEDTNAGRADGALHRVDADGSTTEFRSGVGVANGLGFDPTRGRMFFADTPTETVLTWDFDPTDGTPRNERVFFDYSTIDGLPDGACVDSDGCYWSASVYGWAVTRITPEGVVDRRIELPVQKPSMPAFGGVRGDTLFVTSIGSGGTVPSEPGRNGVAPGALLAVDLSAEGITGPPDPHFGAAPPT